VSRVVFKDDRVNPRYVDFFPCFDPAFLPITDEIGDVLETK